MPSDLNKPERDESAAEQLMHLTCTQLDTSCGLISTFQVNKSQFGAVVGLDLDGRERRNG